MSDAVIVSAVRTPMGSFLGSLSSVEATDLGALGVKEAVRRSGVEPSDVDEVIMGNVLSAGLGQAPGRQATIKAGLPSAVLFLDGKQSMWFGARSRDACGGRGTTWTCGGHCRYGRGESSGRHSVIQQKPGQNKADSSCVKSEYLKLRPDVPPIPS